MPTIHLDHTTAGTTQCDGARPCRVDGHQLGDEDHRADHPPSDNHRHAQACYRVAHHDDVTVVRADNVIDRVDGDSRSLSRTGTLVVHR